MRTLGEKLVPAMLSLAHTSETLDYKAIVFMTRKGPTSLEWLTPDQAKEVGVAWFRRQPPCPISFPPKQLALTPPLQVTEAWSKLVPRPVTIPQHDDKRDFPGAPKLLPMTTPERGNETVVLKQASPFHYA